MGRIHKLIGIALVAAMIGGTARAADTPDTTTDTKTAARTAPSSTANTTAADTSRHSCLDMNQGTFEWRWANVPFASTCDAAPDRK